MEEFSIKEFNSKNYDFNNYQEFLPLFNAYLQIAVDKNEVVSLEDLTKTLPKESDPEYAKIACIKDVDALISDNSRCFVLYKENTPVSFSFFSKDDSLAKYHLELVHTGKEFKNKGYAKKLLTNAFEILKEDAFCVSATVNGENLASQGLNSSLNFPYSMQEQHFVDDNDKPQELMYYFHIINKEMYEFIKSKAKQDQGIIYLSNNIGNEEYNLLKNMMKQTEKENLEKE